MCILPEKILAHPQLSDAPILVVANKSDVAGAMSVEDIMQALPILVNPSVASAATGRQVPSIARPFHVLPVSARTGYVHSWSVLFLCVCLSYTCDAWNQTAVRCRILNVNYRDGVALITAWLTDLLPRSERSIRLLAEAAQQTL
jgi:hypothetical protein